MKLFRLLVIFAATIGFQSCSKEAPLPSPPVPVVNASSHRLNPLCNCGGYTLQQDQNGDYSCPSGDGCTKVVPCPCATLPYDPDNGSTDVTFELSYYNSFITALNNNHLPEYFSSDEWQHIFPALIDHPDLLSALRAGTSTVEEKSYASGDKMYLVIPANLKGSRYTADQVQLPISIPAAAFE